MSAWVEPMLSNAIVATLLAMLIGVVAVFRPRRVVIHALWLIVLLKLLTPPLIRFELRSDLIPSSHRTTMSSDSFDGFVIDSADSG